MWVNPNIDQGSVIWLQSVTDQEYPQSDRE